MYTDKAGRLGLSAFHRRYKGAERRNAPNRGLCRRRCRRRCGRAQHFRGSPSMSWRRGLSSSARARSVARASCHRPNPVATIQKGAIVFGHVGADLKRLGGRAWQRRATAATAHARRRCQASLTFRRTAESLSACSENLQTYLRRPACASPILIEFVNCWTECGRSWPKFGQCAPLWPKSYEHC